jgi:hypothetical protein
MIGRPVKDNWALEHTNGGRSLEIKSIEVDVYPTASGLEATKIASPCKVRIKAAKGKNPRSVVDPENSPGPVDGGVRINQTGIRRKGSGTLPRRGRRRMTQRPAFANQAEVRRL